ncbi:hypothetical protein [Sorangium sp. So ce1024]|uniref:hypothetical protein n=1 Tax=Sorangium sp. So ce1024 TaxID=3133327 RepID=UPI003F52518A
MPRAAFLAKLADHGVDTFRMTDRGGAARGRRSCVTSSAAPHRSCTRPDRCAPGVVPARHRSRGRGPRAP